LLAGNVIYYKIYDFIAILINHEFLYYSKKLLIWEITKYEFLIGHNHSSLLQKRIFYKRDFLVKLLYPI
jgi:hypothetical protein